MIEVVQNCAIPAGSAVWFWLCRRQLSCCKTSTHPTLFNWPTVPTKAALGTVHAHLLCLPRLQLMRQLVCICHMQQFTMGLACCIEATFQKHGGSCVKDAGAASSHEAALEKAAAAAVAKAG